MGLNKFVPCIIRVSLNSPTCRKTLVGVRVRVPISEQAEKSKKLSFHAF